MSWSHLLEYFMPDLSASSSSTFVPPGAIPPQSKSRPPAKTKVPRKRVAKEPLRKPPTIRNGNKENQRTHNLPSKKTTERKRSIVPVHQPTINSQGPRELELDYDALPVPNFANLIIQDAPRPLPACALSPLTPAEQRLPPPPRTPKTAQFLSPLRPRTPGSGILSPATKGAPFRSPTFRELFSNYSVPREDAGTEQVFESFKMLTEECYYDSDEYEEADERFPAWIRRPLTQYDLRCSNQQTYCAHYAARDIASIRSTHIATGTSSEQFDLDTTASSSPSLPYASITDFLIGKPIGSGKFGTIYVARAKANPDLYVAIKVMFKRGLSRNHVKQLLREIRHLDAVKSCDNVISIYDFFHDASHIYLVMEYANEGDLYHSLSARRRFSEEEAASVFRQAVLAVQACHAKGIVHRDIKPENFVWGAGHVLKLIDFGWSAPCKITDRRDTLCGTLDYIPPEMVVSRPYGHSADVWCLGVLLFELLTGSPPFEDEDFLVTKLNIKYVTYSLPDYLSTPVRALISSILRNDPHARPTTDQILESAWLKQ